MRLGAGIEFVEGILFTVFPLDSLAGAHRRARDEAKVVGKINKYDFAVIGMDAFSHFWSLI
jgi:hypothetical protein